MNPGIYALGDFTLAAAGTQTGIPIINLSGMTAATISARLAYGSGGTSVVAVVQTSLDQGTTWIDVARVEFAQTGEQRVVNLSGLTPRITPYTVAPLAAEGSQDGILGDRLRAVVTSTGTYAGSTVISLRVAVR